MAVHGIRNMGLQVGGGGGGVKYQSSVHPHPPIFE